MEQHLLSAYCVTGTILGIGEVAVNTANQSLCPPGADILVGETHNTEQSDG